jgi:hypothetical protein
MGDLKIGGRVFFSNKEMEHNAVRLCRHAEERDVPDVIGYADIAAYSGAYGSAAAMSLQSGSYTASPARGFPWPNGPKKLRTMAILDPRDELVLRAIGGVAARLLAPDIDSKAVFSGRTRGKGGQWYLAPMGQGWNDLNRRGRSLMRASKPDAVLRSDVKNYYGSCQPHVVAHRLLRGGMDPFLVEEVRTCLELWTQSGVPGLPIGPEFSGVVGTGLLTDVDRMLHDHPAVLGHLRFTDDLFMPVASRTSSGDVNGELRSVLAECELAINWSKTELLTPDEAWEKFGRGVFAYIGTALSVATEDALYGLLDSVESFKGDPDEDLNLVNYALSAMTRHRFHEAVPVILGSEILQELTPKRCADFLLKMAPIGPQLIETEMLSLLDVRSDRKEARDLHMIRAMEMEQLGKAEGKVLLRAALDSERPAVTKSFALVAAAKTPAVSDDELTDLALGADEDLACRAAVLAFKGRTGHVRDQLFADRRLRTGDLRFAAAWASAA